MTFVIEKGITLPPRNQYERKSKYPFADMEVGDSFLVPYDGRKPNTLASSILASSTVKKLGIKISTREEETGIRVWRIA